jgi:hypothetical protein
MVQYFSPYARIYSQTVLLTPRRTAAALFTIRASRCPKGSAKVLEMAARCRLPPASPMRFPGGWAHQPAAPAFVARHSRQPFGSPTTTWRSYAGWRGIAFCAQPTSRLWSPAPSIAPITASAGFSIRATSTALVSSSTVSPSPVHRTSSIQSLAVGAIHTTEPHTMRGSFFYRPTTYCISIAGRIP